MMSKARSIPLFRLSGSLHMSFLVSLCLLHRLPQVDQFEQHATQAVHVRLQVVRLSSQNLLIVSDGSRRCSE